VRRRDKEKEKEIMLLSDDDCRCWYPARTSDISARQETELQDQ
jgi:hypothetical protein